MVSKTDLKNILDNEGQKTKEALYSRGFIITNSEENYNLNDYPFYNNWTKNIVDGYSFYCHKLTTFYSYKKESKIYFLIGHAYNPFKMISKEDGILEDVANQDFVNRLNELTGNFILGYIENNEITFIADPTAMQISYYGFINDVFYLTSHAKLVGDLLDLEQDEYVKRLVSYKFYHLLGKMLPGDLSPYKEMKRTEPNFLFSTNKGSVLFKRIYPLEKVVETKSEEEYQLLVQDIAKIMNNTMSVIAQKWSNEKIAISITGGRDSLTTLSSANGFYDKFSYFSYISTEGEKVDAYAAKNICEKIGIEHEIYDIDLDVSKYPKLDVYTKILDANAGCIGGNHQSDVQKRIYFLENPHFDIEVKSWVDEIGRARYYKRFNKKRFSKYPTARNLTSAYKFFLNDRKLVKETDRIFKEYLEKYYDSNEFDKLSWTDLFYWEFSWATKEGLFLNSEHRVSYEITIPFNNRILLNKMLQAPLEKRIGDRIQIDVTDLMNYDINNTGIHINDISHTSSRAKMEGLYYSINSFLPF